MITAEYAAGFFDGEGCVSLWKDSKEYLTLSVAVANNDRDVLIAFQLQFGGAVRRQRRHQRLNQKVGYRWEIRGRQARPFLELIRPIVRVKKAAVELGLEFLDFRAGNRLTRCVLTSVPDETIPWRRILVRTQETVEREAGFKAQMNALNFRGLSERLN